MVFGQDGEQAICPYARLSEWLGEVGSNYLGVQGQEVKVKVVLRTK